MASNVVETTNGLVNATGTAGGIADRRRRLARLGGDHGLPLLLYFLISLGLTWPLVRDFTTRTIGVNHADPRHSLWMLWHGLQWTEGRDGFTASRLVYAPHGTSLLTDGVGPLSGIVSVPFWVLGPVAAYNGVVLMGIWLTAYFMYLLARAHGTRVPVAFFAGVVYQLTPIHLAGIFIHLEKTFIGFLPLTILVLLRALDPGRTLLWILAVGAVTLAVGLHSGYQLVYAALSLVFWTLGESLDGGTRGSTQDAWPRGSHYAVRSRLHHSAPRRNFPRFAGSQRACERDVLLFCA